MRGQFAQLRFGPGCALLSCGSGLTLSAHHFHRAQDSLFKRRKIIRAQR
jgi:hypothetical protein